MEQLLISRKEAAKALGISIQALDLLTRNRKIECFHMGSRVLYTPMKLRAFVRKSHPEGCRGEK